MYYLRMLGKTVVISLAAVLIILLALAVSMAAYHVWGMISP